MCSCIALKTCQVLMRGPFLVFLLPLCSQLLERSEAQGISPRTRSLMGLVQWLVVPRPCPSPIRLSK